MDKEMEFRDILKVAIKELSDKQLSIWLAGCYGIFGAWCEEKIDDTTGIKKRFLKGITEVKNGYLP